MISERDVIFEDNHLIAVYKKAGDLSQGDQTGDDALAVAIKDFLKAKYQKPGNVYLATLHRLDRPVQGIMLFAKTSKAAERMSKAFKNNEINKTYLAILDKKPMNAAGLVESYLLKDQRSNTVKSYPQTRDGAKFSQTEFKILDEKSGFYLIELHPVTGRSHQLRVHCAQELRCPIVGDVKYGSQSKTNDRSLYLMAKEISFEHPVTKEQMRLKATMPQKGHWRLFAG